jgi:hypothetical protein
MGTPKGSRNVDGGRNPGTFESDSLRSHQHIVPNVYQFSGNAATFLYTRDNALMPGIRTLDEGWICLKLLNGVPGSGRTGQVGQDDLKKWQNAINTAAPLFDRG